MQATDWKRARSEDEKVQRRHQILDAAEMHFREAGFEGFSMARLAKLAGVAKGTLYLYFTTREEVLLSLYGVQIERFGHELRARLSPGMSDDKFVRAFHAAAHADHAFVALSVRLNHVIENNVSIDALVTSKRAMRATMEHASTDIAATLGLTPAQAFELTGALASLLIGSAGNDSGPDLDAENIPEDVRQFMNAFHTDTHFLKNARRILAGIRAGL